MLRAKPALSLIFLLAGAMDWLTTTVGIAWFGAAESNPIIAGIANTNLPLFAVLKLAVTIIAALFFHISENVLLRNQRASAHPLRYAHAALRIACITLTAMLLVVVANNLFVVAALI